MVVRLIFFMLMWAAVVFVPGGLVAYGGYRLLRPWREKRRQRRLAQKRGKLLLAQLKCFECGQPIDTNQDVLVGSDGWAHRACYAEIVK